MKSNFLHFNDGVCVIDDREYFYQNQTIGFNRNYAARAAGVNIDRMIYIDYSAALNPHIKRVEIDGKIYAVEQFQVVDYVRPKAFLLTLSLPSRRA